MKDAEAIFSAAKEALANYRKEVVAEYGENSDQQYGQPLDVLIKEELHCPNTGKVNLGCCIRVILDKAIYSVPGAELYMTSAG